MRTRNFRDDDEDELPDSTPTHALDTPSPADTSAPPSRSGLYLSIAALVAIVAAASFLWSRNTEYFWRSPIAGANLQSVTNFGGIEEAAAVSRDGKLVAFLSDRDGPMDVWLTQVGSGEFHNLTHGSAPSLVNPSVRTLGFSPDGSLVTFWTGRQNNARGQDISIWAVPALGGQPRLYFEKVAELDWSRDGSRVAYHTPGPGDPLYISNGPQQSQRPPIFTAPTGLHAHFPLWSPDGEFIYFVQGTLPDKLDIWRIRPQGGTPERITSALARVSHPVFLDSHTLLYLASDPDGSGPWLYSMDLRSRKAHRLSSALDRYTSLAASADGHRLVATLATPNRSLWRLPISGSSADTASVTPIHIPTASGFSPRFGPGYLLYLSTNGTSDSLWKLSNGATSELWTREGAHILGGPAVSRDGNRIAFSVRLNSRTLLLTIQPDGTNARVISDNLNLQGDPAWSPDGRSIIVAAENHGLPHLLRVPVDGSLFSTFIDDYSVNPAWTPDGELVVYSGPDIGATFPVKAVTSRSGPHPITPLTLTRGTRHLAFLPGGKSLVLLRGDIDHKNLWIIDLDTGAQRQLTTFAPGFDIRDFDISPDGREVVLERSQERADIVLLDLPQH
jgi:Tol biopolymer transport system component